MSALTLGEHLAHGRLGGVEKPGDVGVEHPFQVLLRVFDERLGDEDSRVVHQRVDASKTMDGFVNDTVRHIEIANVTRNGVHVLVASRCDGPGVGDHGITEILIGGYESRADALRSSGDHDDLLGMHVRPNLADRSTIPWGVPLRTTSELPQRRQEPAEKLIASWLPPKMPNTRCDRAPQPGVSRRLWQWVISAESVDAFKLTKVAPGSLILDFGDRGKFTLVIAEA